MELLTLRLGETALALFASQVSHVGEWGGAAAVGRLPLAEALGLPDAKGCERELVCPSSAGAIAFGIASAIRQEEAADGALVSPSRVLRRLGAPGWLAGFYVTPERLALIVDLAHLTDRGVAAAGNPQSR